MKKENSSSITDFFPTKSPEKKNDKTHYRVYFGTTAQGDERGIYMAVLDLSTGTLSEATRVSDSMRPGFIAIHPDGKTLYATEAAGNFSGHPKGAVSSYQIKESDGTLKNLNNQPSGGIGPCHVSIDPSKRHLLVANYREGSCAALTIQPNRHLSAPTSVHKHHGSSTHPDRQTSAHVHSINCDPSGHFALVADLGTDQIHSYRLDGLTGHLLPNDPPFIETKPGSGPRHLAFLPSKKLVFVSMELSNEVVSYEYDSKYGTLEKHQSRSTLPEGFKGESTVSEVLISKDNRFLYVGNRGHNSIAIFSIDPESGTLTLVGHEPTLGDHPRHFNIEPTGEFLIVANANADNVVVFRIDPENGTLKPTGSEIIVPHATCIGFTPLPEAT